MDRILERLVVTPKLKLMKQAEIGYWVGGGDIAGNLKSC